MGLDVLRSFGIIRPVWAGHRDLAPQFVRDPKGFAIAEASLALQPIVRFDLRDCRPVPRGKVDQALTTNF